LNIAAVHWDIETNEEKIQELEGLMKEKGYQPS
jgi:hypothetical protein